jgi:hypothetical protein
MLSNSWITLQNIYAGSGVIPSAVLYRVVVITLNTECLLCGPTGQHKGTVRMQCEVRKHVFIQHSFRLLMSLIEQLLWLNKMFSYPSTETFISKKKFVDYLCLIVNTKSLLLIVSEYSMSVIKRPTTTDHTGPVTIRTRPNTEHCWLAYKAPTTPWRWQPFAETCRGRIWNVLIKIYYFLEHLLVISQRE